MESEHKDRGNKKQWWQCPEEWAVEIVRALVANAAWLLAAYLLLDRSVPIWAVVPVVAYVIGRALSTPVTQIRDLTGKRLDLSAAVTTGAWGGAAFGLLLVAGWHWSVNSGFESWLNGQTAWWAYWHWF